MGICRFSGETGEQPRLNARLEKCQTSAMKSPSLFAWYYILRDYHQWTVFQSIRYALWLTR